MMLDPSFLSRPLAHRGLHDLQANAPENSPEAYRRAIAGGYGIELDVQISADGRAMVFHDADLDRMTGAHGPVRAQTATDLAGIPLKGGDSQTIPTLRDILGLVAGRAPLLIEIKDQDGRLGRNTGALEQAVVEDLARYDGPVAVMSFNPYAVKNIHDASPGLAVGLTTTDFSNPFWSRLPAAQRKSLSEISDLERVGACFISHDQHALARPRVAEIRASGRAVLSWTIRSPAEERAARKLADNVTFEGYLA